MTAILIFSILSVIFYITCLMYKDSIFIGILLVISLLGSVVAIGTELSGRALEYFILGLIFGAAVSIKIIFSDDNNRKRNQND